ncbi:hypothetical protein E3P99_03593 [Wallemia hederae]|uniref:BAH domain-containing protein n=1 Tax=Wallemia hederae TaxID=1540922 RepID=A0A4T0FH11_9BASI|nr:hypothetical protein E3P99_03593 [Wallemia hederae]
MAVVNLYDVNRYQFDSTDFHASITQQLALNDKQHLLEIRDAGLEDGYMREFEGDHTYIFKLLIKVLRFVRDPLNRPVFEQFEFVPEQSQDPYFHSIVTDPFSLSELENNVNAGIYQSTRAFETDLFRAFDAFRLGSPIGSSRYGNVNMLQRFYNGLFAPSDLTLPQEFNYASNKAGPGNPFAEELAEGQPGMEGVGPATSRILTRHRYFHEDAHFRGMHLNMGDWVHIINPDDATKPIPAQLFKVFTPDYSTHTHITVCRYYRPEQTVHAPYRRFYEDEVFKSGNYVDLPIEDLLEKTFVMFATKYSRGRPKEHLWDKRRPLYVVEHRYSPKSKTETGGFSKIKSWNACIPEEVRKTEYEMNVFEEQQRPTLLPSPFLRGIEGPGRIDENAPPPEEVGQHAVANAVAVAEHMEAMMPGSNAAALLQNGQLNSALYKKKQKDAMLQQTNQAGVSTQGKHKRVMIQYDKPSTKRDKKFKKLKELDRSLSKSCKRKDIGDGTVTQIPEETAAYFDRDLETDKLKWFSGPPVNLSKKGQTVYSAKYVYNRLHPDASHKRKRKGVDGSSDESLKAFDDFCQKELEQPNRSAHQVTSSALDASEALLYLSESITKSSNLL